MAIRGERAAGLLGFGMPPAQKEKMKTAATCAEERITGAGSAHTTRNKGTSRGGTTAVEEFEDKYSPLPFTSTPGVPSPQADQSKLVVGSLKRHIQFWEILNLQKISHPCKKSFFWPYQNKNKTKNPQETDS